MGVVVQGKNAKDIVIFVNRLAEVPALLLVPPLSIGVTVPPLLDRWVDVAAVLEGSALISRNCLV
jgi:hypothetical protein